MHSKRAPIIPNPREWNPGSTLSLGRCPAAVSRCICRVRTGLGWRSGVHQDVEKESWMLVKKEVCRVRGVKWQNTRKGHRERGGQGGDREAEQWRRENTETKGGKVSGWMWLAASEEMPTKWDGSKTEMKMHTDAEPRSHWESQWEHWGGVQCRQKPGSSLEERRGGKSRVSKCCQKKN